ncbi:LuxR family two component transcriptional regulator [Mucilaginibacter gracilis]|uniref:LuxR family two component transcriptional regulator n=1 Tax=Mucilaginibacter gracilis TaxID=423350 RepID=A0A495IX10_9SPHI|nr:response regulator transcription factor [Mucilaginibacter gracilis]RKR81122.1 LuxR family two component transcriptional regulator [Mucilaginibacter gracilis]
MPSAKLKIFIVDDHYLILQGLSSLLTDEPGFEVCGLSKDPTEVLALLETARPDILLTDISMPVLSGAELTTLVLKKYPRIKVIALSMYNEPKTVNEMVEAGVSGYLLKATSKAQLIQALKTVANGRTYFTAEIQDAFNHNENPASRFTSREIEILRLIVKENSNKQIAQKLFISERTVETHRRNILRKTDAVNTVGMVRYAYENKII